MATPLRKDPMHDDLTTADPAKSQSLNPETRERKPLLGQDNLAVAPDNLKQIPVKVEKTTNEVKPDASLDRTPERETLASATDRGEDLVTENKIQPPAETPPMAARSGDLLAEQPRSLQMDSTPLFPGSELEELRTRWKEVQTAFVDEPRSAVQQADRLVASAMKRLSDVFADERSKLERQWDRGDDVSTEDLRLALQRYRTFFQRLLAV